MTNDIKDSWMSDELAPHIEHKRMQRIVSSGKLDRYIDPNSKEAKIISDNQSKPTPNMHPEPKLPGPVNPNEHFPPELGTELQALLTAIKLGQSYYADLAIVRLVDLGCWKPFGTPEAFFENYFQGHGATMWNVYQQAKLLHPWGIK